MGECLLFFVYFCEIDTFHSGLFALKKNRIKYRSHTYMYLSDGLSLQQFSYIMCTHFNCRYNNYAFLTRNHCRDYTLYNFQSLKYFPFNFFFNFCIQELIFVSQLKLTVALLNVQNFIVHHKQNLRSTKCLCSFIYSFALCFTFVHIKFVCIYVCLSFT